MDEPSYAVVTPVGDYNRTPRFHIEGNGDEFTFERRRSWSDGAGNPVTFPSFPMAPGEYRIEATGGRYPKGAGVDEPVLVLSRIIDPRFVTREGRFIVVD